MLQAVANAFKLPDLRRKILFTLGILVVFRFLAHVPIPGVNAEALRQLFQTNQFLGLLDMFSGGAMSDFSIMAMGVYPLITANIVFQLLQPVIPQLEQLAKEGEAGRNRLNQYQHLLAVPLAALQGYAQCVVLQRSGVLTDFGFSRGAILPTLATLVTLTAGTMIAVWLGELIDQDGIGNGISLIIFGGIVADIPSRVGQLLVTSPLSLVMFLLVTAITVVGIVYVQEGQRRIPVQYAKRVRGTRIYGGQSTHIPLQVNSAGMIPLIFAVSFMLLPGVISSYFLYSKTKFVADIATAVYGLFDSSSLPYWIIYFLLVVGFTYFYTDIVFRQQNLAENLQRQGGFIPGIRPGRNTEDFLNRVVRRITLVGALFLGAVAILPFLSQQVTKTSTMLVTSTGLLIVVGVVLDSMKQLEAQLLMRHYEGFIKR